MPIRLAEVNYPASVLLVLLAVGACAGDEDGVSHGTGGEVSTGGAVG
ncbi:MAG: hypothetical protein JW751_21545 [Polyangiaceae bacterium]|nr:hypothetical protein [Polyangiaceae bacterium]